MKKIIDLATWNRREHFAFFSRMDEPFHGIVANVDCTATYHHCRQMQQPFFLNYLHKILQAANETEAFRLRIENGTVVEYERIHCNVTVGREDGTFGFCALQFEPELEQFLPPAQAAVREVKQGTGLGLEVADERNNEIHVSVLPAIRFTGLTHARRFSRDSAEPKISVGQIFFEQGRWHMPLATFVHHGLVDGQHVAAFLARAQSLL